MMPRRTQQGFLLVLVLVFGGIFFMIVSSFIGYVVTQSQLIAMKVQSEKALNIAEAGLEYYRWYLAHYPDDTTNGTATTGPHVHTYDDPEGGALGEFSLDLASSTACGDVYAIDVTSTGYTHDAPNVTRTIHGRYTRPTVSEYAYIINANVWAGSDRTIIGPYHSNGAIRMDGTNLSTVTSGQATWVCNSSTMPCTPGANGSTVNGVYGDGPNDNLWMFPSPPINFTGLTVDLSAMQTKAQTGGGTYIGPSGQYGYRLSLQNDGTVDVYVVDQTFAGYFGYTTEAGWQSERHVIQDDDPVATYTINPACPVIYVEDKVWLEGEVSGKVTIAAADVDTAGVNPSIILNNNITYVDDDSGLLAIGEQDVLVGLVVPTTLNLNGIFIAQNGRFGRNHYTTSGAQDVLEAHNAYVMRSTLNVNGTIVSNGREGTKWVSAGVYVSGFNLRNNSYDRDLVMDPPPMTPETSDTYRYVEWRDMD